MSGQLFLPGTSAEPFEHPEAQSKAETGFGGELFSREVIREIEWNPGERPADARYGKELFAEEELRRISASVSSDLVGAAAYYDFYIHSAPWNRKAAVVRRKANGQCAGCGCIFSPEQLEVHHDTYERFGREHLTDLRALCDRCHPRADEARRKAARELAALRNFQNWRASGYAKFMRWKYGEDWRQAPAAFTVESWSECEEWFDDFQARRELYPEEFEPDEEE
jgi:hypothetical protein